MSYQIHETVIRDVIDLVSDIKKSDEVEFIKNRGKSFSSIAKASSNLTLVFPVLVSKNMNIENASMVSKATERKAVTMLQMLFSAIQITDSKDGIDYLKNFHTNLKMDGDITVDSFMNVMDKYVIENASSISYSNRELYEQVKQDMKNISYVLPEDINEQSIGDFKIYPQAFFGESTIVNEAIKKTTTTSKSTDTFNSEGKKIGYTLKSTREEPDRPSRDKYQIAKDIIDSDKSKRDMFRNQLLDTDIKKANELVPSMMIINFTSTSTGESITTQMIIGVKAKMYTIDSKDVINRITIKNQDRNGLLKFIRATTREISFVRDFLFAIDRAKVDALSQSRRGSSSKLWKILERRSTKSKIRRAIGKANDASAITTLVISQEEVEYLKKSENIDVENERVIRPIMEAYNLMSFCIVDETMEVVKFLYDTGNDTYETLPFTLLERETSDGGYKKVINLMTKMSR